LKRNRGGYRRQIGLRDLVLRVYLKLSTGQGKAAYGDLAIKSFPVRFRGSTQLQGVNLLKDADKP
jgi:hypothetical protein